MPGVSSTRLGTGAITVQPTLQDRCMENMLFNGWFTLVRTVIVGGLAYAGLILLLRGSGKRTLSKMNAFDLIVTVALGSTIASITLSRDVPLAQGVVALALLITLQYAITWSSVRWGPVRRIVTGEPSLLFYRDQYLHEALRSARVTAAEVRAAVRGGGYAALEDVEAVVLETDGSFSIVRKGNRAGSALADVKR
jgi:uncharacterized membrane protein YcaP (DUF421 family)